MARLAICSGVWPGMIGSEVTSARCASCSSCNCAAGRWVSRLASRTFLRSRVFRRSAILPEVVVLPEPWRPTIRIGSGAGASRLSGAAVPPSASTSASLTIFTTIWPGETERSTSAPTALLAHLGDEILHHRQAPRRHPAAPGGFPAAPRTRPLRSARRGGAACRKPRKACPTASRTWCNYSTTQNAPWCEPSQHGG